MVSSLLSVETVAFSVLGYPLSYIELTGTVLYLWSVWLISQRNMWTWPVGIVSVLLYMALFYQIRLYSDALEQVYYLAACTYGWWYWMRSPREDGRVAGVRFSRRRHVFYALALTVILSAALGAGMGRVHLVWPRIFPAPASYPYLDALTTIMSFTAMWLMARKCIESWIYWIVVDVIGIGLYYAKEIRFVALLYVLLLFLASRGLICWMRAARQEPGARRGSAAAARH